MAPGHGQWLAANITACQGVICRTVRAPMNHKNILVFPLAFLLCSTPAFAQQPALSTDRVVYEAGFYHSFAPRTALDMINQTPGFALDANDGDEARRGFSGAVGNVLIDGQRLGAKSQSLRDVLGRVAAAEVLRIEVLRGSAIAGDASGAAVLANVVRTPTTGGGTWEMGFEVTDKQLVGLQGLPNVEELSLDSIQVTD